jgi:hypothetical protein
MNFFNSLSNERKLQAIDSRIDGLKEQMYGMLVASGINPEEIDILTFDPQSEIDASFQGYVSEVQRLLDLCKTVIAIREQVAA